MHVPTHRYASIHVNAPNGILLGPLAFALVILMRPTMPCASLPFRCMRA